MKYSFKHLFFPFIILGISLFSCEREKPDGPDPGIIQLSYAKLDEIQLVPEDTAFNASIHPVLLLAFSTSPDTTTIPAGIFIKDSDDNELHYSYSLRDAGKTIAIDMRDSLDYEKTYSLVIGSSFKGVNGEKFPGLNFYFKTRQGILLILSAKVNGMEFPANGLLRDIPLNTRIDFSFNFPLDTVDIHQKVSLFGTKVAPVEVIFGDGYRKMTIKNTEKLDYYIKYNVFLSVSLKAQNGFGFEGFVKNFFTALDSTFKFPLISDEELLDLVQQQTFKYFWDFGHPVSGLARERNTSGDIVASGGSGFGIMAIVTGMERGFITRSEGVIRLRKIVDFLEISDRFHGAWSHWLNGSTGKVIPFGSDDDGGDLVETSYLAMGLLTARQYLNPVISNENSIIEKINILLDGIEWDWYTQGQNSLTWHWSPKTGFAKNMKIRGWNEALITYVMAATSTTHPISKDVYVQGWAGSGAMVNNKNFFGIKLPLGPDLGGPLFFEQYSFLGLDPGDLSDTYGNYMEQAVNHTLINRAYCIQNPKNYIGYSETCWGLTASDNDKGYSAHSPTNDLGVITPTAALSSFPFTPEESLEALKHFYYLMGDRLWGPYGFYDAFNVSASWYASSYIAIDQGPIIGMIENYRSGLLWQLFMSAPEVEAALTKLGFNY